MNLPAEKWRLNLVSSTADGANVNTGIYNGLLTQLQDERPWMLKIHCVNHRIELSVKDAMDTAYFKEAEKFYTSNYYLLRNSGSLKSKLKASAEALNITYYPLTKAHGTRFVGHRKKAYTRFIHMWPTFITTYEDASITTKDAQTRAKIKGLLKKFKDAKELLRVCSALEVLEMVSASSKIFEGEGLMPYEVTTSINIMQNQIDEFVESTKEELLASPTRYINSFEITPREDLSRCTLFSRYPKAGHERKKEENREFEDILIDDIVYGQGYLDQAIMNMKSVARDLKQVLEKRFESFDNPAFQNMKWFDPKFWNDDKTYGLDQIQALFEHFREPLESHGFDVSKAKAEWKSLRILVSAHYQEFSAKQLWKIIVTKRSSEFPQMTLLAKLVISVSGSNSTVERAFSILSLILSDRRVSLKHDSMVDIIMIKANNKCWSEQERNEILDRAYELYTAKRRKVVLDTPPEKRVRIEVVDSSEESDEESEENNTEGSNYSYDSSSELGSASEDNDNL